MFDAAMMESFRDGQSDADTNEETREAWATFCIDFFECVNYSWKTALHSSKYDKELFEIENVITPSDEALLMWFIDCKYDETKKAAEREKNKQSPLKKHKDGAHDSKSKIELCCQYYARVKERRQNVDYDKHWKRVFWDKCKTTRLNGSRMRNANARSNSSVAVELELP